MEIRYRKTKMNSHKMKYLELVNSDTMNVVGKLEIVRFTGIYGKDLVGRIIVCKDGTRYRDLGKDSWWVDKI